MGVLSPEALIQAHKNIQEFNPAWTQDLIDADSLNEHHYQQFIEQLKMAYPSQSFKELQDIPKTVLTSATQLDRSCFTQFEKPVLVEFALRFENNASFDKLITVPTNTTVFQLKTYIFHRLLDQLYERRNIDSELAATLPLIRPTKLDEIVIFWRSDPSSSSGKKDQSAAAQAQQSTENLKEVNMREPNQQLQELISAKCWRIDNLTPGIDLMDNFWNLALQENNYELIREKLYFKFVQSPNAYSSY